MNNKDRIWYLAGKKLAGEANADELTELEGLLRSEPDMHYSLQNIHDIWSLPDRDTQKIDEVFNRHVNRMKAAGITDWQEPEDQQPEPAATEPPLQKSRSFRNIAWVSVMACLVIAIAFFIYFPAGKNGQVDQPAITGNKAVTQNEISTRNGSKTKISLPDGSTVWLNSGSKLTYPKEFGNSLREVELTGEAFFDVVKNPDQPFIIHTRQLDIRVIGTAFNVKSYPGDQRTTTSLVRGKVEVSIHNRPNEKIILKPNEKLVVLNNQVLEHTKGKEMVDGNRPVVSLGKLTYATVDSIVVETAWVQNKLVFNNESFEEVAAKMKRWYNVEFEFADAGIRPLRFTGVFENETIQQALDAMRITADFHYRLHGNRVIIQK
jgi:transmembrane sensor